MQLKTISSFFIILIIYTSCVKQVTIKTRNAKPILVVEGEITTDTIPYSIKLSYSGPYKSGLEIPDQYLEKNAKVTIKDDQGKTTILANKNNGIYETNDKDYIGKTGRSYSITIELKDGTKYISIPEKIQKPVPISNVNVKFVLDNNLVYPASMHVLVDANDPGDQENYYKWNFYSWTFRQTHGIPCGNLCIEYEYCFQKITDKEVRILSDASINGNVIKDQMVGKSYIYTYGNAYVDIAQLSLTREAYQFWKRYNDQVERTGNILDPLPASVKGNIYNAADPNDFALGYFSGSAVVHKRIVLIPYSITEFLLNTTAVQFIPPGSKNCFLFFPNALFYPPQPAEQYPPPLGWEGAEKIEVRW